MSRLMVMGTAWILVASSTLAAEDKQSAAHRVTVTSATKNKKSERFKLTAADLPGDKKVPWSIHQTVLHGGKQEGVELLTLDNGKLAITVVPTRGMSILEVRQGDLRLGWNSPVKEVVHPQFINLERRGGLGWLEGFNEWMVRCGLEYAGHPGLDEFVDNTGKKAEMNLTLHGRIANLPASEVEVFVDRLPPHRLRLRGIVHERSFYGPKLELETELSTEPGSDSFRIVDKVTNHAAEPQEFTVIYHTNYGAPLLEKGANVVAAVKRITPMNEHAARSVDRPFLYEGPTKGFIEQVYLIEPRADDKHATAVLLRNRAGDLGTSIAWSTKDIPYLTIWKNTAAEADGYVTGLEPGTNYPFNRKMERRMGRLAKLQPGQSRQFTLDFAVHLGKSAVAAMAKRIEDLQAHEPPIIEREPARTIP